MLHAVLLAQNVGEWFSISTVCNQNHVVCSAKGECMEHGVERHEIHDDINVYVGFTLEERIMGHIKLLLSKGGLPIGGGVE